MGTTSTDLTTLPLSELARMCRADWPKMTESGPDLGFGPSEHPAKPYCDAMLSLSSIDDSYYQDEGRGIVAYFLSNATSWRGDTARAVKAELKRRLGR